MVNGPVVCGLLRKRRLVSSLRKMLEKVPVRSGGIVESYYFFKRQRKTQWIFNNVLIFLSLIAMRA